MCFRLSCEKNDYAVKIARGKHCENIIEKLGEKTVEMVGVYYRATLCVSAVLVVGPCLSVRLSVTLMCRIETA